MKLVAELDVAEKEILNSGNIAKKNVNWLAEYNKIINRGEIENSDAIENTIRDLTDIYRKIDGMKDHSFLTQTIEGDISNFNNLYKVATVKEKVNSYIDLLEKETDFSSQAASARFLAASSIISNFWEYDLSKLPPSLSKEISEVIPSKIDKIERKIKRAKSKPIMDEIITISIEEPPSNLYLIEGKIKFKNSKILKISNLMQRLLDADWKKDTLNNIRNLQVEVTNLRRKQFTNYQIWASKGLIKISEYINTLTVFSYEDAERIIDYEILKEIDVRLLDPELAEIYSSLRHKILDEPVQAEYKFAFRKKFLEAKKKKLKEF